MSSISSLQDLCKKAALKHPRLFIQDSKDNFCKNTLETVLGYKSGIKIVNEALKHTKLISVLYEETEIKSNMNQDCAIQNKDNTQMIFFNKKVDDYYFTNASQDDISENFLKYFDPNELKQVARIFDKDTSLVHEFCHAKKCI